MIELGPRGAAIIKRREVLRLVAYLPTPKDKWTIGWGHTRGVVPGLTCTKEQAERWFHEDTAEAVSAVAKLPCKLTPSMADALISLAFNAGEAVAPGNTIYAALSASPPDYFRAWAWMTMWRKQAGKDLLGLARRRAEEMVLFLEDGLPAT